MKFLSTTLDVVCRCIAFVMPRRLKYWVTIQSIGTACRMQADIMATPVRTVVENLEKNRMF
jgi:hypothetical protein